MEKIVLVHYINISDWDKETISKNFNKYSDILKNGKDYEYLINFILPTHEGEHRIECINPKMVSPKEYEQAMLKLDKVKEKCDEFLKG